MPNPEKVAASLTKAQRDFVLSLPEDGSEKCWPTGMRADELSGLRGFEQLGIVAGRYVHSGVYHHLTPFGLAVRPHLLKGNPDNGE